MLKTLSRGLLLAILGRRLPKTAGGLETPGARGEVVIRRDRWGIPYVEAGSVEDGWYGLGFCHGQDRAVQLEGLLRLVRGTLAEAGGPRLVPMDRLSRRIGFLRSGAAQFRVLGERTRRDVAAYARGLYDGATLGCPRRPHEFALAGVHSARYTPQDVMAVGKLVAFSLSSNWDVELARVKILQEDGVEALAALERTRHPGAADIPDTERVFDALASDLTAFAKISGFGGMSNGWAVAPGRTATGRPILANDPHLRPELPPNWYLARVSTPEWTVAGASFVGAPLFAAAHNGSIAWGVTAGLVDNTDLFLERLGPDGRSVLEDDEFVGCDVFREVIGVKGGAPLVEDVVVTKRGPIIGPVLSADAPAVSLAATWLGESHLATLDELHKASNFDEFRRAWSTWNLASFGLVYADEGGGIGGLMAGQVPSRRKGYGTLPAAGWDPDSGWEDALVQSDEMPAVLDPEEGFVATANSGLGLDGGGPFMGADWLPPYRRRRITEMLTSRNDWNVESTLSAQMDLLSLPWLDMRQGVLDAPGVSAESARALEMLATWDGRLAAESAAASVYEFFAYEMTRRLVETKAPNSHRWAFGAGFTSLTVRTIMGHNLICLLVRLMKEQPSDWFGRPWLAEVDSALAAAYAELRLRFGPDERRWAWGRVRPTTLRHPASVRRPLGLLLNLGPFPWGGDSDTVSQAASALGPPSDGVTVIASMRMVIDVGNWDASRFVLPGGQSGNPLSPHYSDMLPMWRRGTGVPIAWSPAEVGRATVDELRIVPSAPIDNRLAVSNTCTRNCSH